MQCAVVFVKAFPVVHVMLL